MSDVFFPNELDLAGLSDEDAGAILLSYARRHPQSLTEEAKREMLREAFVRDGADRIRRKADQIELSEQYGEWRQNFLDGRGSKQTRRVYAIAIARFEAFCESKGYEPTALSYKAASEFAQSPFLKDKEDGTARSAASCRQILTAVSSLYSEMSKLSDGAVFNPFTRLKAKPAMKRAKDKPVPTPEELEAILANTSGEVRAAIACMAFRGFRIGALPELRLATRDGKTEFYTFTKGKEQTGELPQAALEAIDRAGLSRKRPFDGNQTAALEMRVQRELDRLAAQGLIAGHAAERMINKKPKAVTVSDYSCHSFRHFYAVAEYNKDFNVERVRKLLNHAGLNTTQAYLQSLGQLEE